MASSIIPSFFCSQRIWDPFDGLFTSTLANVPSSACKTSAFVNARIDWRETPEAHIFKADLPGLKKEVVKVEVEQGRKSYKLVERGRKSRSRMTSGIELKEAVASF
ncbi:heat-shock protein, putative [Ricinus communis]|uniref:Heat-shock protein, putative n=1 Tax=Ricinus communis TaxID=3988 RepID=B9SN53_RICCO|nr:heat-shock protein, putative [Ricinus communis]